MNAPTPENGGWTAAKGIAFALALIGMLGFGFCALCGLALTVEDITTTGRTAGIWQLALMMSVPGVACAVGLFFVVRSIFRSTRRPRG